MRRSFIILAVLCASIILILCFLSTQTGVLTIDAMIPRFIHAWAVQQVQGFASHDNREWENVWYGVPILQYPNDLMVYENLITKAKPDMIIETGTWCGGLTLYLATLVDRFDMPGQVVTIDIDPTQWEKIGRRVTINKRITDRITFIQGNSTAPDIFSLVSGIAKDHKCILVILDSDHRAPHVLSELNLYSTLVTPGSYIIVNDTASNTWEGSPGPYAAVNEFLRNHEAFMLDPFPQRYSLSSMHSGILKRLK